MKYLSAVPRILPYESPSSWLTRAALSQGVQVRDLMLHLGIPLRKDPDLILSGDTLVNTARLTRQDISSFAFAVHMFSGVKSIDPFGDNFLLLTNNRQPRYRYCPLCLNHPGCKSFPVHWRFKAWQWCPLHDCLLQSRCPHCKEYIQLPGDMLTAGPGENGIAFLDRCLHCAESIASGWESTPHPMDEDLLTIWEMNFIENGRSVLSAFFHRHFSVKNETKQHTISDLNRIRKLGVLPHENFRLSIGDLKERRISLRSKNQIPSKILKSSSKSNPSHFK